MKYILLLVITLCIIAACSSAKRTKNNLTATNKLPSSAKEQIRFGHGGGFTGAVTEYLLKEDGSLFKQELGNITKLAAKQKEADQCFSKCQAIQFQEIQMDSPGNRYAFIAHHKEDRIHRVTWNPHQSNLSAELIEFHNMLLTLVGEEPMTIIPDTSKTVDRKDAKQKALMRNSKPIQNKSDIENKLKKLKKLDKNSPKKNKPKKKKM